jgi:hypothetical protein
MQVSLFLAAAGGTFAIGLMFHFGYIMAALFSLSLFAWWFCRLCASHKSRF